jgi:hypothetical protein
VRFEGGDFSSGERTSGHAAKMVDATCQG